MRGNDNLVIVKSIDDGRLHQQSGSLQFIGIGTYTHTLFGVGIHVYSVAMYMKATEVVADPVLTKYRGKNVSATPYIEQFVKDILLTTSYDRVMHLQLAMTLSKSTLMRGLVDDLPMKEENKVIIIFPVL